MAKFCTTRMLSPDCMLAVGYDIRFNNSLLSLIAAASRAASDVVTGPASMGGISAAIDSGNFWSVGTVLSVRGSF